MEQLQFHQGKVTISTGTFDVDGTINCTANLEFTDAGSLNLSSTVTSLGTFKININC